MKNIEYFTRNYEFITWFFTPFQNYIIIDLLVSVTQVSKFLSTSRSTGDTEILLLICLGVEPREKSKQNQSYSLWTTILQMGDTWLHLSPFSRYPTSIFFSLSYFSLKITYVQYSLESLLNARKFYPYPLKALYKF